MLSHSVSRPCSRIKCGRRTSSLGNTSQARVLKNVCDSHHVKVDAGALETAFLILNSKIERTKEIYLRIDWWGCLNVLRVIAYTETPPSTQEICWKCIIYSTCVQRNTVNVYLSLSFFSILSSSFAAIHFLHVPLHEAIEQRAKSNRADRPTEPSVLWQIWTLPQQSDWLFITFSPKVYYPLKLLQWVRAAAHFVSDGWVDSLNIKIHKRNRSAVVMNRVMMGPVQWGRDEPTCNT